MIYVFGDSFSRVFTLFKDSRMQVFSYKGATLKGITKNTNDNRLAIERAIKKNKNITHAVFSFGQVDLNLSFYYDIVKNNGIIPNGGCAHYSEYIKQYIGWVSNIPGRFRRIIIVPYPSPLDADHTLNSLINYGSLTKEEVQIYHAQLEFCTNDIVRSTRYFEFIHNLQKNCIKFNFSDNLIFVNLNKYILNENLLIKNEFCDVSEFNMHLRWGPLIPFIIREFQYNDVPITSKDVVENIDEIEDKYIQDKTQWLIDNKQYWTK
jgi:hypothetical protein